MVLVVDESALYYILLHYTHTHPYYFGQVFWPSCFNYSMRFLLKLPRSHLHLGPNLAKNLDILAKFAGTLGLVSGKKRGFAHV